MISVLNIFEIYLGREEAWNQVWQETQAALRRTEGFRTARLYHDVDKPQRRVVLSEWEDRTHYDAFARHSGLLSLLDAWEFAPGSSDVMVVRRRTL